MTIDLETLYLAEGAHNQRDDGMCLLEAVAWFAGKKHTDHPPCVSPVLGAYGRALNDALPDNARQALKRFIRLLPGTAGDGKDRVRGFLAVDWLARVYVPAFCDLVPALAGDAAALRALPRITDMPAEEAAVQMLGTVRGNAKAAGDAGDAAGDAARAVVSPTVASLQESAVALFAALIAGEQPDGVQ